MPKCQRFADLKVLSVVISFGIHLFLQRKERAEKAKAEAKKRKQDFTAGRMLGVSRQIKFIPLHGLHAQLPIFAPQISGREMFEFNPDLVSKDDDDEEGGAVFNERDVYL